MNQIQLKLFPHEVIQVGVGYRPPIVCFKFEEQVAWTYLSIIEPISLIFRQGEVSVLDDLFSVPHLYQFVSYEVPCYVGTWEKLIQVEILRLVPNLDAFPLFDIWATQEETRYNDSQ